MEIWTFIAGRQRPFSSKNAFWFLTLSVVWIAAPANIFLNVRVQFPKHWRRWSHDVIEMPNTFLTSYPFSKRGICGLGLVLFFSWPQVGLDTPTGAGADGLLMCWRSWSIFPDNRSNMRTFHSTVPFKVLILLLYTVVRGGWVLQISVRSSRTRNSKFRESCSPLEMINSHSESSSSPAAIAGKWLLGYLLLTRKMVEAVPVPAPTHCGSNLFTTVSRYFFFFRKDVAIFLLKWIRCRRPRIPFSIPRPRRCTTGCNLESTFRQYSVGKRPSESTFFRSMKGLGDEVIFIVVNM